MEPDPVLSSLVDALRAALAQPGRRLVFVQLLYADSTSQLLPVPIMPGTEKSSQADSEALLSDREKAVLQVLARAERPLKGRAVATRAGIRYTSHFRELMAGLVQKGLVRTTRERCYWPADRPLPEGEG